jgi:hypothetical protein
MEALTQSVLTRVLVTLWVEPLQSVLSSVTEVISLCLAALAMTILRGQPF